MEWVRDLASLHCLSCSLWFAKGVSLHVLTFITWVLDVPRRRRVYDDTRHLLMTSPSDRAVESSRTTARLFGVRNSIEQSA